MVKFILPSLLTSALLLTSCGSIVLTTGSGGPTPQHKSGGAAMRSYKELKIPKGHLPPVGKCKIWRPGTPPGHQRSLCDCRSGIQQAGVGDMVLYRKSPNVLVVKDVTSVRPLRYSETSYSIHD